MFWGRVKPFCKLEGKKRVQNRWKMHMSKCHRSAFQGVASFRTKPGKFMVFHEGLQSLASQNGASQYPKTEKSVVFLKNIQKNANIILNIAKKKVENFYFSSLNLRFNATFFGKLPHTPLKLNMEPKNHPTEKENHLPNLHFQVPC